MIEEIDLDPEELAALGDLVPGREPDLRPCPAGPYAGRLLRVSSTRLDGNELSYVTECIRSNWISSAGAFVPRFEEAFSAAVGCAHGVACANGTAALHLAVAAHGVGPGDEVIVPTFTMVATPNAVRYTGATPVLVDADYVTWTMDVAQVAAKIGPRTRGIIAVHIYGHPVDMDPLRALAARHGLFLLEDAAEAHGAFYHGRPAGSLGDSATFSFYGNKIVTTGEGGMVTTNDARIARITRKLRDHAFSEERHFWHKYLGFNYRMTSLQAAVGLAQTERLGALVEIRRASARLYAERLSRIPGLTLPVEQPGVKNVFWMYGVLVEDEFGCSRDELRSRLAARGVETRTFFVPIHLQPIYFRAHRGERHPVSETLCRKGLYLPSGPMLTETDVDFVADEIARARMRPSSMRR
jgi:perosamine synthetase